VFYNQSMSTPILTTKLYIPPPRPKVVIRPRLIKQLNEGVHGKLTLVSAPAGFGKTTLISEWVNQKDEKGRIHPSTVAWLSLDEGDSDPIRFLTYFVAALQTVNLSDSEGNSIKIGNGVLAVLQSPQPPSTESILTTLLNEITAVSTPIILILDDYHLIDSQPVDKALTFLLDHLPPHMHLIMTTREDPNLPLSRLRVRGQLTELRATNLRFTPAEAATFLNQVMGLSLSVDEISALETRTEGWIAGLQLAALSMQGQENNTDFIQSFTGSHRFILDYLLEEVLNHQPEAIQTFLLHTSILDRMCSSLCDAVLQDSDTLGQETLAYLEQSNLFILPLDNERRWYRYHHLFGDLLQQRLQLSTDELVTNLHSRASVWYEENDLEIEAFQHAAAANDIDRAERLMAGRGMPLLLRGAVGPVMNWLASLPTAVLDARPSLWVTYATAFLFTGQITGIEEKLQCAEAALQNITLDDETRDLIGRIASMRSTLAVAQNRVETIIIQSRRAQAYLHPDNLPVRTSVIWNLGYANELQGNRQAAKAAYLEAVSISESIGHFIIHVMSLLGVGAMQEGENDLHLAAETYQKILKLIGDPPIAVACAAHLGLAGLYYEWNDLESAENYGQQSLILAQQFPSSVDREVASDVFLARLKLAQGDASGAATILASAEQSAQQHNHVYQIPKVAAAQVLTLLDQGNLVNAAQIAQTYELPLSQARVHIAQENPAGAQAVLASYRQQMEAKGWADELLKVMMLQAVAYYHQGEMETAVSHLTNALELAEPGGFIRLFLDEGKPIVELLLRMKDEGGRMKEYIHKLLAAFGEKDLIHPLSPAPQPLIEPLSPREIEVLQLVARGYSNRQISEELFLALNTVKGHNRRIFGKLNVQRRTEAVARARELGLV